MIGQRVGSYVIESQLGMGGMGAVYRARHAMLGRAAAIKILLPQFSANADIVHRFFNEARAATEIRHLGIVEIFDFGQMDDGAAYIAMELLDGEALSARMHREPMPIAACLRIIRQMCGPLGAAHERGIVHRDLKPDNVFIVRDDEVAGGERIKLLDFGIAKVLDANNARQTTTGAIMGTPMYMAPEQCRGVPIDHRADLYAMGCILFELVRQRTPFVGEGVGDIMGGHMFQPPPPLGSTLAELDALVARMLAKAPADRPQSSREIADAIDRILPRASSIGIRATIPASMPPSSPTGPNAVPAQTTLSASTGAITPLPAKRTRAWLVGVAAIAVAGAAVGVFAMRGGDDAKTPTTVATTNASDAATSVAAATTTDAAPVVPAVDAAIAPDAMVASAAPIVVDAAIAEVPPDARPSEPVTAAKQHRVTIRSAPSGATVTLAGKAIGTTPYTRTYAPGTYSFTLSHSGYVEKVISVNAASGSPSIAKLVPIAGAAKPDKPATPTTPQRGSDDAVNPFGN